MRGDQLPKRIKEDILTCGEVPHLDETPRKITTRHQSNGYMWVLSNPAGSFYQFDPKPRWGAVAKELIGSYRGPAMTDGYSGYKASLGKMDSITLVFAGLM